MRLGCIAKRLKQLIPGAMTGPMLQINGELQSEEMKPLGQINADYPEAVNFTRSAS